MLGPPGWRPRHLGGMADVHALVSALGGMAQKRQLVARGATDRDLTAVVKSGAVLRVRNGWYSTFDESDPKLRAVRVGGRLTGLSLVRALGGWVLGDGPLHVSLRFNSARMRTQQNRRRRLDTHNTPSVVLHWEDEAVSARGTATSVDLIDALVCVVLNEELEVSVAAIDWALRTGRLDEFQLERMLLRLPQCARWIRDWVDRACDSLPESLARTRLSLLGHVVRSQVRFGTDERIDLVVDETVAIETDGEEHHWDRFEQDRAKDMRMTIAGFHALRPSARMVFHNWPDVLDAIEVALVLRRGSAPTISADRPVPRLEIQERSRASPRTSPWLRSRATSGGRTS